MRISQRRAEKGRRKLPAARAVDVSSLRTAASGECVDVAPASSVRCTLSVVRRELNRVVLRAHVINDTDEIVHCAPGRRSDSNALLQTGLELTCDPHAELGFLFSIPRFGGSRLAFVRVSGRTFACGFEHSIAADSSNVVAVSIAVALVLIGVLGGVVLYERSRRRGTVPSQPEREPASAPEPNPKPIVPVEVSFPEVKETAPPVAEPAPTVAEHLGLLQARGFAAVLDENRAVMAALECTRRRFASSDFVAKVVNQASEPLHCTLDAQTSHGAVALAPHSFSIHPQSAVAVDITAPVRIPWRLRTIYLRMENSSVSASAQADVPVTPFARIAGASAIAALVFLIAFGIFELGRPKIAALAVPSQVTAGNPVTASYALSGMGRAYYEVRSGNATIASGSIPAGSGSFTFPTGSRTRNYLVRLRMSGPFGSVQKIVVVPALAHLLAPVASIAALSVSPGVAAAGAPLRVRYAAQADGGTVSLLDISGLVLQSTVFTSAGNAVLRAPPVEAPTQYQIALDVVRAGSHAHATVALLVLPKPLATPPSQATPAAPMLTAAQFMRIVPPRVVSAHAFSVQVLARATNLWLTLQNSRGITIATQPLPSGTALALFQAPPVTHDERFVLVARFTLGNEDQVLLDPLVIHQY